MFEKLKRSFIEALAEIICDVIEECIDEGYICIVHDGYNPKVGMFFESIKEYFIKEYCDDESL